MKNPLSVFILGAAFLWLVIDIRDNNMPKSLSLWCHQNAVHPMLVIWLASGFWGSLLMLYSRTKGRRLHEIAAFMSEPADFESPVTFIGSMAAQEAKTRSDPKIGLDTFLWVAAFFAIYSSLGLIQLLIVTIASGTMFVFGIAISTWKKLSTIWCKYFPT